MFTSQVGLDDETWEKRNAKKLLRCLDRPNRVGFVNILHRLDSPNLMRSMVCLPLKRLKLAILSLAFGFVVAAPSQLRADCTDHSFRPIAVTAAQHDDPSNAAFLARVSKASDRGILATLQQWFSFRAAIASPRSACQPCQRAPFVPGHRCEGPSCSGDPSPATTPVKVATERLRESVCVLSHGLLNHDLRFALRRADGDKLPASVSIDPIFHPPRSL
jgi:hypothetical protein